MGIRVLEKKKSSPDGSITYLTAFSTMENGKGATMEDDHAIMAESSPT